MNQYNVTILILPSELVKDYSWILARLTPIIHLAFRVTTIHSIQVVEIRACGSNQGHNGKHLTATENSIKKIRLPFPLDLCGLHNLSASRPYHSYTIFSSVESLIMWIAQTYKLLVLWQHQSKSGSIHPRNEPLEHTFPRKAPIKEIPYNGLPWRLGLPSFVAWLWLGVK